MKIQHRVPARSWYDSPVSDVTDEIYEAKVSADTARGEREYRTAQEKLRKAEGALERQQQRTLTLANRSARKQQEKLVRQLEQKVVQRREELEEVERLMSASVSPGRVRHRTGLDDHLETGIPAAAPINIPVFPVRNRVEWSGSSTETEVTDLSGCTSIPPLDVPAPLGERRARRCIPQAIKVAVAARDQGRCQCTAYPCHGGPGFCWSTEEPQFDHVIPWSQNGADTVANVIVKCGRCNRRKGARYIG